MDTSHQKIIKDRYYLTSPLFNEILESKHSSIIIHNKERNFNLDQRMRNVTKSIHDCMPVFFRNLLSFLENARKN